MNKKSFGHLELSAIAIELLLPTVFGAVDRVDEQGSEYDANLLGRPEVLFDYARC